MTCRSPASRTCADRRSPIKRSGTSDARFLGVLVALVTAGSFAQEADDCSLTFEGNSRKAVTSVRQQRLWPSFTLKRKSGGRKSCAGSGSPNSLKRGGRSETAPPRSRGLSSTPTCDSRARRATAHHLTPLPPLPYRQPPSLPRPSGAVCTRSLGKKKTRKFAIPGEEPLSRKNLLETALRLWIRC